MLSTTSGRFVAKRSRVLLDDSSGEKRVGVMTHCVRPKSSRKFRKCVPAGLEGPENLQCIIRHRVVARLDVHEFTTISSLILHVAADCGSLCSRRTSVSKEKSPAQAVQTQDLYVWQCRCQTTVGCVGSNWLGLHLARKPGWGCVGLDWQLFGNLPRACPTQTDYYKPVLKTMVQQASEVLSHLERSPVSPFSWPTPRCHGRVCVSKSSKPLCLGAASCGETLFFPSWLEVKLKEPACQGMVEVRKEGVWVVKSYWHSNVVCWWPGCYKPQSTSSNAEREVY